MTDQTTPPPGAGPDQPPTASDQPSTGADAPSTGADEPSTGADQPHQGRSGSTTTAPPPAAAAPQPRPLLRRTRDDKVVAGVAGGLARTLDLDPVIVRIITVVLCLSFPPALIAYFGAWLLVARDDEQVGSTAGGIAFRAPGGVAFWIGVVILAIATLAALDDPFRGGFNLVPLVLIGIGVALWARGGGKSTAASTSPGQPQASWPAGSPPTTTQATATSPTSTTTPATAGGDMPTATHTDAGRTTTGAPAGGTPPPAQPPTHQPPAQQPLPAGPPPPPRPTSPLGAITIALALITTGVVAALDQVPGIPLDAHPSHLAAVALLVLGLGQVVGAFWGRARWLTLVAIFLIPPVLVGTLVRGVGGDFTFGDGIDIGDGVGERVLVLDGDDTLPRDVGLLAGTITIDLQDWEPTAAQLEELSDADPDLVVNVGFGEVVLITPTDVPWRVVGRVGLGDTSITTDDTLVQRDSSDNLGAPLEVLRTGGPQDGPVLDIVVDLRVGELDLHTPPFTPSSTTEELS